MDYYWIFRCTAVVKQTIRHCLPCRRMLQDVSIPQLADLPAEILPVKNQFFFETTGLDFIGLFPVKNHGRLSSRYFLLFARLVVRAVHLEVSNDLTTDSAINCIRRFISRRGKLNKFVSDSGKSFVGSNNALQYSFAELKESKIFAAQLHLINVEIDWKFNPPAVPNFGGIWERLVQIFKLSLYKIIGSRTLTEEILSTVSCEKEASMISRPLTNVPYDINDPLPPTPKYFLLGCSSKNLSLCVFIGKEKNLSKGLAFIITNCNSLLESFPTGVFTNSTSTM